MRWLALLLLMPTLAFAQPGGPGTLAGEVSGPSWNTVVDYVVSDTFTIRDSADETKRIDFDLSGLTTATTRTVTFPNISGNVLLDTSTIDGSTTTLVLKTHATDCSSNANGTADELCIDENDGEIWRCDAATCTAADWVRASKLEILLAGASQGLGLSLDFANDFSVTCDSNDDCSVSLNASVYSTNDSAVPSTMNDLPTSGAWAPTVGTITHSGDCDSANELCRKSYIDTAIDTDVATAVSNQDSVKRPYCWGITEQTAGEEFIMYYLVPSGESITVTDIYCFARDHDDVGTPDIDVYVKECTAGDYTDPDHATNGCGGTGTLNELITACDKDGEPADTAIDNGTITGPASLALFVDSVTTPADFMSVCVHWTR